MASTRKIPKPTKSPRPRLGARSAASPKTEIILGLGSNLGDSEATLLWALEQLTSLLGPLQVAPLFRTEPVSPVPQDDYLNTVAIAEADRPRTVKEARQLLLELKELERCAGRLDDGVHFGPRPLDIDLLLCGDLPLGGSSSDPRVRQGGRGAMIVSAEDLVLPHPRMHLRRFVLEPLACLRPCLRLPPDGATVEQMLAGLGQGQRVERREWQAATVGRPTLNEPDGR